MKITIIGTGYVGLVTGACISDLGIEVCCVDIDKHKIDNLNKGILPIYEPGLKEIIDRNFSSGRISFHTDIKNAIDSSEAIFIAVGTPPGEDGSADLKYVLQVADTIGKNLSDYAVVITKSTVPVGTAEKVRETVSKALKYRNENIDFDIASNPEFLKEGAVISDFKKPDRIVIGVDSERSKIVLRKLYNPFIINGHSLIFMDIPSAEMTKYAANAMLATKISFMNDIANLCEILGANVNSVRKGIGSDTRIGNKFIYPGIGYGGSCFPKDVKALAKSGMNNGYPMRILEAVEKVNKSQKRVLFDKINLHFDSNLNNKVFAFWGLSFKPNTDDMREAPSLILAKLLLESGSQINVYDPVAMDEAKKDLGDSVNYCDSLYDTTKNADAIILITEWSVFRVPDWGVIGELLNEKTMFDGRNLYKKEDMNKKGYSYYGIGV